MVASSASAVGEILDISGDKPAGAVAVDNGEAFADAITKVLRDSSIRKTARQQAERYSWSQTISSMLQLHNAAPVADRSRLTAA